MKNSFYKTSYILGVLMLFSMLSYAQTGNVTISQDPEIVDLLEVKKEINKSDIDLVQKMPKMVMIIFLHNGLLD